MARLTSGTKFDEAWTMRARTLNLKYNRIEAKAGPPVFFFFLASGNLKYRKCGTETNFLCNIPR